MKRSEALTHAATRMDLEDVMLSERSQTQKAPGDDLDRPTLGLPAPHPRPCRGDHIYFFLAPLTVLPAGLLTWLLSDPCCQLRKLTSTAVWKRLRCQVGLLSLTTGLPCHPLLPPACREPSLIHRLPPCMPPRI